MRLRDRYITMTAMINHFGDTFEEAFAKSEMTLREAIYVHDHYVPQNKRLRYIRMNGKMFKYIGNGVFRRVDSLGRFCLDGKNDHVKVLGFVRNPLEVIFNDSIEKIKEV